MKSLFWTGYSNEERHSAINSLQRVVSKHGSITDFKPFSDLALTLVIEIKTLNIQALYDELQQSMTMDGYEANEGLSQKETTIFLNVTFSKGIGNLKIEVPAVPG